MRCFALPVGLKAAWNARAYEPWIDPALQLAAPLLIAYYAIAALRLLRRYREQLAQWVSNPPRYASNWLAHVLGAALLILAAWAAYRGWEMAFRRLSYFDTFGLYVGVSVAALYLAVEG